MNIVNNIKVDFFFMQKLFDSGYQKGKGWKSYYFNESQACFKKHYSKIGKWKINENDPKKREGHIDDNGLWSWTNRINTHPNCCLSFYNWAIKYNPNMFIEFGNPEYHEYNAKQMWSFIDNFFDLIFTTQTTGKYIRELKVKCQKSWNNGNITVIAIIMSLFDSFGYVKEIDYTFDYGDGDDMNGVDLSFKLPSGEFKTMQIKSGTFQNMGDEFHIKGSPNDLTYNTDYYGYANVDDWRGYTSVIIFNNSTELRKDDKIIIVKKKDEIYNKIQHMSIPEKLNELLVLCGRNDIEFILKKEDDVNSVNYDNETKKITINFIDHEDKEMETLLDNKLIELKKLFK